MKLRRLVLKNFRNYSDLSWNPHHSLNIVSGNNAQGKTNLLEAIFFCTAGRSFRTSREREMIGWTAEGFYASTELENKNSTSPFDISVSLGESGRTSFSMSGRKQNRGGIFQPYLSVAFTPADLDLVRGSPSERRRWIDLELGPFERGYAYNLGKYERVLEQRNNLLRGGTGTKLQDLIDPWNDQMFIYGSSVISARMSLLKAMYPHFREVYAGLTSGREEVSFNYLSSLPLEKGFSPGDLQAIYRETVKKRFLREADRRQSLFGPHRDDLVFMINGSEARKYGSRGQQRSVVLALKIALMRLFLEEVGEYPVLLLDDVFLELDRHRQEGLQGLLEGEAQVFITSDRVPEGRIAGQGRIYRVDGGKIFGGEE